MRRLRFALGFGLALIYTLSPGFPSGRSGDPQPAGQQVAEQAYPNIQILKGMPAERVPVVMSAFGRALGVPCTHCHVEGVMEKEDRPTFAKTRRMFEMRNWIAESAKVNVACWTCHRGHAVPESGPQSDASLWPAALRMTAAQGDQPARNVFKNLKFLNGRAADLQGSMLFMAASLGVGCSYCHAPEAWESDEKPAKDVARRMLAMVRDERAAFSDIRVGCPTCHHGAVKIEISPPP